MLSDDYADKVIVTTIQKLSVALDSSNKNNYKDRLIHLKDKRIVFIFDECHRSQFGYNHKAIKEFFPNAQLFGFTGTPIFEQNATYTKISGEQASYKITEDIFPSRLHAYTIHMLSRTKTSYVSMSITLSPKRQVTAGQMVRSRSKRW